MGEVLTFPKRALVKLEGRVYRALMFSVFEHDRWRCKVCGKIKPLQAHHLQARSAGRMDVLENLVSLCASCHQLVTEHRIVVEWENVAERRLRVIEL